jgi:NitT/TauT family transport system permease protein
MCCPSLHAAYGYWGKDRRRRVLVPLLDILQSIPVLGFMPGLILALVALFPHSNTGLELAAVIMIFTGQAWNMTFSYYHSLRSVPVDLREVGSVYRFSWWQRLKWLELPYATMGLSGTAMSMAGGWFFLMINESFRLGDRDFRLPGIAPRAWRWTRDGGRHALRHRRHDADDRGDDRVAARSGVGAKVSHRRAVARR